MNDFSTPTAAFIAGIVTSLHCCGMCGPLTGALFSGQQTNRLQIGVYHFARIASYALTGGLLGALGAKAAILFSSTPSRLLPWAFALLFIAYALGLEKKLPQPRFLSGLLMHLNFGARRKGTTAALLGFFTPLLPCAPLYLGFGVALLAGSFLDGSMLMAAFAAGTLPLYMLLQTQYVRLSMRWSPAAMQRTRQILALSSAALVIWRTVASNGLAQPSCPFCH